MVVRSMDAWMHSRGCSFFLPVIPLVGNSEPESEQKKGQQDVRLFFFSCFFYEIAVADEEV